MDLQADSVQGVVFLPQGLQQDDAVKLWNDLFPGDSPDQTQRPTGQPSLQSVASGVRNGYRTTLTAQVGRIDLFLTTVHAAGIQHTNFIPRIADVAPAISQMGLLLKEVAQRLPATRYAIVTNLGKTVEPGFESAETLKLLPGYSFPVDAIDVSLRLNVRKSFAIDPNLKMNRLCVWSGGPVNLLVPSFNSLQPSWISTVPIVAVVIDINTSPDVRLPVERASSIIDELAEESRQVCELGIERLRS